MAVVSKGAPAPASRRRTVQPRWQVWPFWPAKVDPTVAILAIACALMVVFTAPHAAAQGCTLCYQSAAASGRAGRTALRHGVMILLVPAISLFIGILALIYRRRNPARHRLATGLRLPDLE